MAKTQGPLAGFRDLLAEQLFPREELIDSIKKVFELYGFVPLKTPAIERLETLSGKYGDEGDKLMYKFKDNGGRDVALRYDQTVPLARVIGQYGNELPKPYKRYALGYVWRGERPQAGRYREFAQFDADIIGSSSYLAETEIIAMMSDVVKALGVKATIRVNDRLMFDALAESCGISEKSEFNTLVSLIDKIDKIGLEEVLDELKKVFSNEVMDKVKSYLTVTGSTDEKLSKISSLLGNDLSTKATNNLKDIIDTLAFAGYSTGITFDQTIVRGLSYYTGTIYETTLDDLPGIGSFFSGGRFDNLIKQLGGPDVPAVGSAVGVDRLFEGMKQLGLVKEKKTKTKVYITNVEEGLDKDRFKLVQKLRNNGITAELTYDSPKLGNQIKAIDKLGVEKIIILGSREIENGTVVIKDLKSGDQKDVLVKNLVSELK